MLALAAVSGARGCNSPQNEEIQTDESNTVSTMTRGPGIYNVYWRDLAYYISDAWPFVDENVAAHNAIMKRRVSKFLKTSSFVAALVARKIKE